MKTFNELKDQLEALQVKYSDKYFIFIAPYDLKLTQELKIFDYNVYNKIQPSDNLLKDKNNLDIYFVEHKYISGMRNSV